jgi:hypothetical protein
MIRDMRTRLLSNAAAPRSSKAGLGKDKTARCVRANRLFIATEGFGDLVISSAIEISAAPSCRHSTVR